MRNLIASIQTKLKQVAATEKISYQLILTRFFQERLLYRIFISPYKSHFCLKGGALLYAFEKEASRPTMDIDLLGLKIDNDLLHFKDVFFEICQIEDATDAVTFDLDSLTTAKINKVDKYAGVRVKIEVKLGNIKQNLQIDIGFGDVVTSNPIAMDYLTLLAMNAPKIQAYSIETLIAEKFEAMISLAEMNSRMKDFYDIYSLLLHKKYDLGILKQAIANTFERRKTDYVANHPIFTSEFAENENRLVQWKSFLTKSTLDINILFTDVLKIIKTELLPIYETLNQEP
jgi:predicted nucleotidyltransferase component of viral defense system